MTSRALSHVRICDFSGQLAGAGATRFLAAFGAEVIRVEDPIKQGRWDILRGGLPNVDERRGIEFGGGFQNHNVEKRGITLNLRTDKGKALLRELIKKSDVVTENFAAGVMDRLGFGYEALSAIRSDIIYVSNCGFGSTGPYKKFKTWGPIVQAVCGLTFTSGLPDKPPAGWGFSFMDHVGGHYMTIAILMALIHRNRTGEGQWVDMSCTEAGATMNGPAVLDFTVNGRPLRRKGMPDSNHSQFPPMAPHGIYPGSAEDSWIAICCRDENEWQSLAKYINARWAFEGRFGSVNDRIRAQAALDSLLGQWTSRFEPAVLAEKLRAIGVPSSNVQSPQQRIDQDANTAAWGLWPTVSHKMMGDVRVDGLPVHFCETDWQMTQGAPCLGQHNEEIYGGLLGLSANEIAQLREEKVI